MAPLLFPLLRGRANNLQRKLGVGPLRGMRPMPVLPTITISGSTRDSAGAALGNCDVHLFRTADDVEVQQTTSDGSGAFSFVVGLGQLYYIVAYKPGSPDVAGTSLNTLAGS